jgi:hypothetical protein
MSNRDWLKRPTFDLIESVFEWSVIELSLISKSTPTIIISTLYNDAQSRTQGTENSKENTR